MDRDEAPASRTNTVPVAGSLPRRLGIWSAAAVVVGIIVGSGIFRVPGSVAAELGSSGAIAVVWLAGGLITLCMALSLGELAALYPRAGGIYVYIREAYGPLPAFLYGWTFLLINPAVWAGIALIFAEYLGQLTPLGDGARRAVAAAIIGVATLANYRSVRLAISIQNLATAAKVAALCAAAAAIFALGSRLDGALAAPVTFDLPSGSAFGVALVSVLFAYEGAASFCALSGEVRDPGRALPRALTLGIAAVSALYLLINMAYLFALPLPEMAASGSVAADAMMKVAGPAAAGAVAGLVMVATFGALAACAIADPRVFYAMSRDGLFFHGIGAIHPRFQTPHLAVLLSGAIAILYVSLHTFEQLTAIFILGLWPFYVLATLAVFVLRRRHPELERPYRVPWYPITPLAFIGFSMLIFVNSLVEQPRITLVNIGVTLLGVPAWFVWNALSRHKAAATGKA